MKKANNILEKQEDEMLSEYNFKGKKGMRGKYYLGPNPAHVVQIHHQDGTVTQRCFSSLQKVILLDEDVAAYFPDSESVNNTLRALIAIVPNKQIAENKAKYQSAKKPAKKSAARK